MSDLEKILEVEIGKIIFLVVVECFIVMFVWGESYVFKNWFFKYK